MDEPPAPPVTPPEKARDVKSTEGAAKDRLAKPPKDRREVIIGPTTGIGPDVTVT